MEPPEPPAESDCCNSGCNPCILDVYEFQLKKYKELLEKGLNSHSEIVNSISPSAYTKFTLTSRKQISPTVFLLKFEYSDTKKKEPNCFKYTPGQYILLRWEDNKGEFTRAYTPLPLEEAPLGFTILVRIYNKGRMSKILNDLQIGHKTSWRGPYGDFAFDLKFKYLFFIAQGTGIAPIFAVIRDIVHNEDCESFVKLFFCCRNNDEILLRDELYEMGAFWNFSYEVFLSDAVRLSRKYNEIVHETKLSCDDIEKYITGKKGLQVLICGSENFNENMKKDIQQLGIESSHIYLF